MNKKDASRRIPAVASVFIIKFISNSLIGISSDCSSYKKESRPMGGLSSSGRTNAFRRKNSSGGMNFLFALLPHVSLLKYCLKKCPVYKYRLSPSENLPRCLPFRSGGFVVEFVLSIYRF